MPTLLKDYYDRRFITRLARAVAGEAPGFDAARFVRAAMAPPWSDLALKQRMRRLSTTLGAHLPGSYRAQLRVLRRVAPSFSGLPALVFPDFVEVFGQQAPSLSLPALAQFTRYSTAEFAIRPFIVRDPVAVMAQLRAWTGDPNEHVRRLASEGCRPRLPWATELTAFRRDPQPVLDVIEKLKADPSEYVRRSVANNLNDIGKDHPGRLLEVAAAWHGRHPDTDRLLKHACRTLLKRGNAQALALFGVGGDVGVEVRDLRVTPPRVAIGGQVSFAFDIRHAEPAAVAVRLEYAVEFVRPGGRVFRKIFQIVERPFAPGWHHLERRHAFRNLTTRTHHPGEHRLSIVANGRAVATVPIHVRAARR